MLTSAHTISAGPLRATIRSRGAELTCLDHASARHLLWDAGAAWTCHSPVLFPIVGRLAGDALRIGERRYTLAQHGFARDLPFRWVETTGTRCALELMESATTLESYPFAFRHIIRYAVENAALSVAYEVN
jgi:galactose mutarotase-like enzyme